MDREQLKRVIEGALLAADEPVSADRLAGLFTQSELTAVADAPNDGAAQTPPQPSPRAVVLQALRAIAEETRGRGYELAHVASGYRFQVRQELSPWVSRLFSERPPRYSRALLETLALIVYRQPITRGEVEEVRGVAVSASIMRTLLERGWIRAIGQRETPGRPTMYGTTRAFLDYFNLRSLSELPPLEALKSLIQPKLAQEVDADAESATATPEDADADNDAPRQQQAVSNVVRLPTAES